MGTVQIIFHNHFFFSLFLCYSLVSPDPDLDIKKKTVTKRIRFKKVSVSKNNVFFFGIIQTTEEEEEEREGADESLSPERAKTQRGKEEKRRDETRKRREG